MGSRGTILVVDDNLDTNEVLVYLLAVPCGVYRAVAAFDGREALGYSRSGLAALPPGSARCFTLFPQSAALADELARNLLPLRSVSSP